VQDVVLQIFVLYNSITLMVMEGEIAKDSKEEILSIIAI
jgi:hypothetical protein